ncbi:hypothetical protein, partial [Arthrobacter sp. DR-2P]
WASQTRACPTRWPGTNSTTRSSAARLHGWPEGHPARRRCAC